MADKLIIVESPAKANTIKKFLGGNTKVVASMGHIRDLPKSKLGIDIEHNFEPEYINIRGKGDLIKSLKKDAKSSKKVYLATDPDREGEAIAWHLAQILDIELDKATRVTFNEITKNAVQKAIKEPRTIDINLVNAQQARRVLDRIVGYKISPVLWKKVKRGLSAGRVQSVAVMLIVDRENEIEKFIPKEYWNIYVKLLDKKSGKTFEAKYYGKDEKKKEINNKQEVEKIISEIENGKFIVKEIKKGEKKSGYNSFLATQIRVILNLLKKEEKEEMNIKKNNDKLYVIYNLGIQIHEELKSKSEDNKLNGYTYKMLNSIKAGNKKEFMDIVIRLHMAMGKDISPIFLETMQSTGLDFESIGHSFLAGLISNKYEKKEEEKIDG